MSPSNDPLPQPRLKIHKKRKINPVLPFTYVECTSFYAYFSPLSYLTHNCVGGV